MSYTEITSQLATASEALEAGDFDRLDTALERLTDAYDTIKLGGRARVAQLQVARTEANLSPDQQSAITTYQRSFMATNFGRGGFIAGAEMYLLDPSEADASELANQASELIDREKKLKQSTAEAKDVLADASLPARIGVLSFSAVESSPTIGTEATVELILENVGDKPAKDAEAILTAPTLPEPRSSTIGTLETGARQTLSFSVPMATGGNVEVSASVESSNAGSVSETTTLNVRTKRSIVQTAKEELVELRDRVNSTVDHPGLSRSITSKLEAAIKSLERALNEIEQNRDKQANNAINTATNQLGALLNSVLNGKKRGRNRGNGNGRGGSPSLSESLEKSLVNRTELAIDHLSDARNTSIEN